MNRATSTNHGNSIVPPQDGGRSGRGWLGKFFQNREEIGQADAFYEKYGGVTIIIARFMPIIRTFAPFVAGVGTMKYSRFISFNVIGGILWCALFIYGGYFFGNIPIVKNNFSFVILAIVFISILPGIIKLLKHRFSKPKPVKNQNWSHPNMPIITIPLMILWLRSLSFLREYLSGVFEMTVKKILFILLNHCKKHKIILFLRTKISGPVAQLVRASDS